MINFNINSFNPFTNLKVRVKGVDDINPKTNSANANSNTTNLSANIGLSVSATNQFLVTDKSQAIGTSLGYGVDKDGYYTSDFNEAAGIPNDYKIHSSTMESLAKIREHKVRAERFISIDVAKAIGSAYKILSQVVGDEVLSSQNSFSKDDIANFPKAYEFDKETFEVSNVYKTESERDRATLGYDVSINNKKALLSLFQPQPEMRNIFDNLNGGREGELGGVFWATTAEKYTNADGTITKGGLLIGIMNYNTQIEENATETEYIKAYNTPQETSGNEWLKNYKSPLMQLLEEIIARLKEQTQKAVQKRLDNAEKTANAQNSQKVDIKA